MREESHLEDMRSAIRGDFERLAERRGEQDLMQVSGSPQEQEVEPPPATEPDVAPRRSWFSRFVSP